jgi:hypothetical protein
MIAHDHVAIYGYSDLYSAEGKDVGSYKFFRMCVESTPWREHGFPKRPVTG